MRNGSKIRQAKNEVLLNHEISFPTKQGLTAKNRQLIAHEIFEFPPFNASLPHFITIQHQK